MNRMKRCGKCGQTKDTVEFGSNRARPDGLQSHCRDCIRQFQAAWYAKNKGLHTANVNKRRKERAEANQTRLIAYLFQHPCVECGEADPLMLDFDHVRGEKRDEVAEMVCKDLGWPTILTEIAKCDVRCVRCHRRRTAQQFGFGRARLMTGLAT